jgi:hypothetical protein
MSTRVSRDGRIRVPRSAGRTPAVALRRFTMTSESLLARVGRMREAATEFIPKPFA